MFRRSATLGACLLAVGLLATPSQAVVIDFQSLELVSSSVNNQGDSYSEDGYTLSETGVNVFATFGTLEARYSGSTALFSNTSNGIITLTKDDGNAFALQSIDLTELNGSSPADVVFTGQLSVGGTTMQTFTLDGTSFVPETFAFDSSFSSVTSVSWVQVSSFHQFDNIVVVPEPASCVGLALMMGMAIAVRRRKKNRA